MNDPVKLIKDQFVTLTVGALSAIIVTVAGLAMGWGSSSKQVEVNTSAIKEIKVDQKAEFKALRDDIKAVGDDVKEINQYLRNRQ